MASVLLVLASACGRDNAQLEFEWEGQHVRIATSGDQAPCPGTLDHLDRFILDVHAALGEPVDPEFMVDYYWLPEGVGDDVGCGDDPFGCSVGTTVYSSIVAHEHEVVHAVVNGTWGHALRGFEEGLATALGDEADTVFTPDDPSWILERMPGVTSEYDAGGAFVWYLLEEHGVDQLRAFWAATADAPDVDAAAVIFADVFGMPFGDAIADFLAGGPHCFAQLPRCGAPLIEGSATGIVWDVDITCDGGVAIGPQPLEESPDFDEIYVLATMDLPSSGTYEIPEPPQVPEIVRCGPCEDRGGVEFSVMNETQVLFDAEPGRHYVRLTKVIGVTESNERVEILFP